MSQVIATNKKAYRDYFLTDKWEAGIALHGAEVKSIRDGGVSFKDSFARIEKGEMYLYSFHINPYANAGHFTEEPDRCRKLLLHKKEIRKIEALVSQKNLTLIPTRLYFNTRGLVKVEIALGKGKKQYDKRDAIKKRKVDMDIKRAMRQGQKR
ncbi:MAG: SsrA-binding protein SmpB [Candidatus Omnitrophica bacterium]|nr:SsrA-binding protein SmpB [Candidatus Omnitrophota bacterium]